MKSDLERLDDWQALCDWLEDRAYNASYMPRCRGAYLLTGPCPARKEVQARDPCGRYAWVDNPNFEKEKEIARNCRAIVRERKRLGLVFWSTGHGWRLHKNYQEKLDTERARLNRTPPSVAPSIG